ncbi:hypothetical protein [Arsenicicoccus dermatophilus]|uniref:hypothetical protein n=1 Tax=Arsenicicoccus dermatophilus TaxID=1076331 RepID=UPI003916E9C6
MTHHPSPAIPPATVDRLRLARLQYAQAVSPFYDEVLLEVIERGREASCLGKADIGALTLWKRLRADTPWASRRIETPESRVREVTRRAHHDANDAGLDVVRAATQARNQLRELPGFTYGDALASAVLLALAPDRLAVYDRRASLALTRLDLPLREQQGRYGHYMRTVESLRLAACTPQEPWTARDVDVALYWIGR